MGVVAVELLTELDCCCFKRSAEMGGTGFLLIVRTEDATGLTVRDDDDVEEDVEATGPRQRFACTSARRVSLSDDAAMLVDADMLGCLSSRRGTGESLRS